MIGDAMRLTRWGVIVGSRALVHCSPGIVIFGLDNRRLEWGGDLDGNYNLTRGLLRVGRGKGVRFLYA